ncbi:restriction endonuclease subunit S [Enterobacter kobei]|uniref:restriction endonuclease subunit S n=1 Tax=Gammaproteobacteria TaxID=1236 RepID=UPI000F838294|nr:MULTISPECIES: restriction endonuclease subunit S [Enterobacter cloacae complex]MBO0504973.1 restriction endonuclease subunit S [Aeromonas veronii]HCT6242752.1 restriction endonuclease subunit S [Citrobacter freundii]EKV5349771.1 restriction endonuclease subunit S [Enterobacter hormaechei]ELC6315106.1 restriction endonuclease subunit S [Enterobacter hormaechei]ELC6334522.1 restriction endonuclease subunit S [Enterobacter hormaechei]
MELMPGYKHSDVGVIPDDWDATQLGGLVRITSGASPSLFRFTGNGIPYFKVEQLSNSGKYLSGTDTPYLFERGPSVPARSVVFAKRGAAIALNKVRILNQESFMDTNLMALTPQDGLDWEYLFYALGYIGLWRFADTTSVPQINNKHVKPLAFPLPTVDEQRAIAKALSDADELLATLDQVIAKKRDLKQAAMQQLLTGKVRLPGFCGEWQRKTLGELGETYGGLTGKTKSDFGVGTAKYITFMNVMTNTVIDCSAFDQVTVSASETQNRVLRGDLLFNGSSETPDEVAFCSLLAEEVPNLYLNSFCFGFRLFDAQQVSGLFLTYYIRANPGREMMKSLAQGSTRYNLSKTALREASVLLPLKDEQVAIADVLSEMDAELLSLETHRDKTRNIKQAMMQELLTGKTRLV